ncbi:hypothetical protein [Spirulina subsalsa]|uniref:hypothetical protein n=1 Tax=Spirulina subsalsa TaxID=54311 RepID=UPI0002D41C34|nr:hypothetical protein [Spirulina subsalsa]
MSLPLSLSGLTGWEWSPEDKLSDRESLLEGVRESVIFVDNELTIAPRRVRDY